MPDPVTEYQSLVTAEESLATLDRAVELARQIARGGRIYDGETWPSISTPSISAQRVRNVERLLKSLPKSATASEVPEAQYALLMDTLLLVFHQAYFSLLPVAGKQRVTLLKALDAFADFLPNLADRFQTNGLLALERGEVDRAIKEFNGALAATPSDQHDFMTRVQMVWSLLMEHRRFGDAFNCLIEVSPRVTRLDYEELSGLLRQTFDSARSSRHRERLRRQA